MISSPVRWCLVAISSVVLFGCAENGQESRPIQDTPAAQLDDAEYLYRLGLIRGHLFVGNALFDLGEREAARTHSKHPSDELYAAMEDEFAARGVAGFAGQLDAHANAVDTSDEATVADRYADLVTAIAASENVVELSESLAAQVIVMLVREAAREYAIGIVDGKLANAHEYQDAYGFTQIALALAQRAGAQATEPDKAVFDGIARQLSALEDMWPSLIPPPELEQKAARLYGAAGEIEIQALDIES